MASTSYGRSAPWTAGRGSAGAGVMRVCSVFFFSSRRRHTRLQGDWSSDVCSSDLSFCAITAPPPASSRRLRDGTGDVEERRLREIDHLGRGQALSFGIVYLDPRTRSEERRVGKECRSRWSPYH